MPGPRGGGARRGAPPKRAGLIRCRVYTRARAKGGLLRANPGRGGGGEMKGQRCPPEPPGHPSSGSTPPHPRATYCHSLLSIPRLAMAPESRSRRLLTEDAVLLQGAVDFPAGVDLEVVLGGTVELAAPGSSPEMLIDPAAAPSISAQPWVARLAFGTRKCLGHLRRQPWGPRLLQQTQEEEDPNYNHCGMMAAALSLLGRSRPGAKDTRGPIKEVLLAALHSCKARTDSSREALASSDLPRSRPFFFPSA